MRPYGPLYVCVACPAETGPWIGDFDPVTEIGECPQCGLSTGIYRADGFFPCGWYAKLAKSALLDGTVHTLDEYATVPE
jgi:hypothetical protein